MKFWIFLLVIPAAAQYGGLATNTDGSRLFFTTKYKQRNTDQPLHGKVFSLDDRELKPALITSVVKIDEYWSNFYDLVAPYLDENGQLAGSNAIRTCYIGYFQACKAFEGSTYRGVQYSGRLAFSPNRRYILSIIWNGLSDYSYTLRDLSTGTRIATAVDFQARSTVVTDDGRVLRNTGDRIQLLASGDTAFRTVFQQHGFFLSGLDFLPDSGHVLTWSAPGDGRSSQLIAIDLDTKEQFPIGNEVPLACTDARRTVDGIVVAQCTSGLDLQLLRLDRTDAQWRPISEAAQSIRSWVVSGDGTIIWYVSGDNAFHKVALLAETDEIRLPPTGAIESTPINTSPGSLFYVNGKGLMSSAVTLTEPGGANRELAPISRQDRQLVYQIPWELSLPLADYRFEIVNSSPSHFELRQTLNATVELTSPAFFDVPSSSDPARPSAFAANPLAAHGDFSRLVTRADPVRPGEVVHLWAVNLGPVQYQPLTGEAAHADVPSPVSMTDFACIGDEVSGRLEVLYTGLAPGMIGIYQVSLRLPNFTPGSSSNGTVFGIRCGYGSKFSGYAILPAQP